MTVGMQLLKLMTSLALPKCFISQIIWFYCGFADEVVLYAEGLPMCNIQSFNVLAFYILTF